MVGQEGIHEQIDKHGRQRYQGIDNGPYGLFPGKINEIIIENMMNPADGGTDSTFIAARPFGRTMKSAAGGQNLARGTCPPKEDHPSLPARSCLAVAGGLFAGADDIHCG